MMPDLLPYVIQNTETDGYDGTTTLTLATTVTFDTIVPATLAVTVNDEGMVSSIEGTGGEGYADRNVLSIDAQDINASSDFEFQLIDNRINMYGFLMVLVHFTMIHIITIK